CDLTGIRLSDGDLALVRDCRPEPVRARSVGALDLVEQSVVAKRRGAANRQQYRLPDAKRRASGAYLLPRQRAVGGRLRNMGVVSGWLWARRLGDFLADGQCQWRRSFTDQRRTSSSPAF